jgi:nitrilase
MNKQSDIMVGLAQIAPVWLNKEKTIGKIIHWIDKAGKDGCNLVVFGEAILPGYPFWVELTNSPEFNSPVQKDLFAHYAKNGVNIESGELDIICNSAKENSISVYLGIIERPSDRGGHSLYCSLVYINDNGDIKSVHRKLMPTYEERLVWSIGDGNGLQVHKLGTFTVGGLNCWENWMPLPRASLYGLGENLHISVWPGSKHNTEDITRFIARESRSFVVSVSGLMQKEDIKPDIPHSELILKECPDTLTNGGSCLAGPDGEWIIEPVIDKEILLTANINIDFVLRERQNFDPSGHYSRPDITKLLVNHKRQNIIGNLDL